MNTFFFLVLITILLSPTISISGTSYVKPYTRSDGTFVQGHYRTTPNNSTLDNYSTKGNVNPYTGERGNKDPYNFNSQPNIYNTRTPNIYYNDND